MTAAAVAFVAINILLSGSHGAMIAGLAATLLAQWRLDKTVVTRHLILAVPLLALVLASEVGRDYLQTRTTELARVERVATLTHRTEMWEQAWPSIKAHWMTGMGLGNSRFILLTSKAQEQEASQIGGTAATLHSQYLVTLAEMGVFGLILLILFVIYMCFKGLRMWRVPRTPMSNTSFILMCSCLFAFADGVLHGWMFSAGSPYALFFWAIVALCLKSERLAGREIAERREARIRQMSAERAPSEQPRPGPVPGRA